MPRNDKEVWDQLGSDRETSAEIDYLTYAVYAFEKYEWYEHFNTENQRYPTQEEVDHWIGQITPSRFASMRERAASVFDGAARQYFAERIEREREDAVRTSILAEVKAAGSFWRQIFLALVTAILAPVIIGVIIVASHAYDRLMPTATTVERQLPAQSPEADKH